MQARQPNDEIRQWERDWRTGATQQINDTAKTLADLAGVVREMQSDVRDVMQWKAGIEQRKDERIEKAPDSRRADLALAVSIGMFVFYLVTFFMQHYKP